MPTIDKGEYEARFIARIVAACSAFEDSSEAEGVAKAELDATVENLGYSDYPEGDADECMSYWSDDGESDGDSPR